MAHVLLHPATNIPGVHGNLSDDDDDGSYNPLIRPYFLAGRHWTGTGVPLNILNSHKVCPLQRPDSTKCNLMIPFSLVFQESQFS